MTKQTFTSISAQPKESAHLKLKLDRQGGARIDAGASEVLRVREPAMRFLHISAGAHLRELDLGSCSPGIDITLDGCPHLSLIRLPVAGHGAVLHLNSEKPASSLEITGTIQSLDACWSGSSFAVDAQGAPPFIDARFGAPRRTESKSHDIVIEYGGQVPALLAFSTDPRLRQLVVLNAPQLKELHLPAHRALERVQLSDCSNLEQVRGARIHRLQLVACPSLQRLQASGHAARLSNGTGAEHLHIEQPWTHLTISDSEVRSLHAPAVGELLLRDCYKLVEAQIADQTAVTLSGDTRVALEALSQLRLDERAISGLLVQVQEGDAVAQRMLEHWCSHARRPWEYLETLRALAAAESDPLYLWRLRCRLHARSNLSQGSVPDEAGCLVYAERHWNWRLPSDRYMEGWEADLSLWLQAYSRQPELEHMLRMQPPLLAVAALARQLSRGVELTAELEELLCRAIRRARKHRQQTDKDVRPTGRLVFDLLVSAAISQRSLRLADAIVQRLQRTECLSEHLTVLASLAAFGHTRARVLLMRVAQDNDPEIRAKAMAMALSPMRSDIFMTESLTEAGFKGVESA